MSTLIILACAFLFIMFPFVRLVVTNPHNITFYSIYDIIDYIIHKKWKLFNKYGIDMFVGMFGHGKTLSMTHYARKLYKQFGNSILFISNYKLIGIPYVPLKNFNQLLELGREQEEFYSPAEVEAGKVPDFYYDDEGHLLDTYVITEEYYSTEVPEKDVVYVDDLDVPYNESFDFIKRWKYQGYVVLIDEIEDVLSHRNYANFPLQLLNVLTQQRKKHIYICCSCQRYFMCDKLFRAITTHVIDCSKFWRFQRMKFYDAWDYENAMNPQLVKCLSTNWWFVKNIDFNSYDTEQMIDESMSADFISNDEKLARIGLDNIVNEKAVSRPSLSLKKSRKKGK